MPVKKAAKAKAKTKRDPNEISPMVAEMVQDMKRLTDVISKGQPIEEYFTVHTVEVENKPGVFAPTAIAQIRQSLGASQPIFADFLGVDVKTVRSWEQGIRTPSGMARRFLDEIRLNPKYWQRRLKESVRIK
jgi:putative transcriptional regulator